ncbi:MAG TPA: prepilin-type N-terminal cleavage/methylation domain-containing protein [Gemmatimonadaceae bacterium]|nr:prepilin-type N-terminal cleavage/methylation domain-containing protein [Gemmatimonadaceae bacterium]
MTAPRDRAGHSLLELLVGLTLLGIVLGAVLGTTLRSWRAHGTHGARAELRAQLEAGVHALAVDLAPLSAAAGDLSAGEARDTSIEIRALVTSAAVCDTASGALALRPLAPLDGADLATPLPQPGDEVWSLVGEGPEARWAATAITSARRDAAACGADGTAVRIAVRDAAWPRAPHAPARITRLARWSLYRAADGWHLGRREWNPTAARFDVVQPVAGPLEPPGATSGLSFVYVDSAGVELPAGAADTRPIARVEVTLRARLRRGAPLDSAAVAVALGRHEARP